MNGKVYPTCGGNCKYHIVIIPKYRKRMLYGKVKKHVGEVIREVKRPRGITFGNKRLSRSVKGN